ncbi:MAG: hypothetical protein ACKVVO_04685 [Opitutaceae bacterium]
MPDAEPLLHQLGTFDPAEATRLVALLEEHHVTFEIDTDQSAFSGSNDFSGLQFGVNPEGAKILIFIPEPELARAQELLARLA